MHPMKPRHCRRIPCHLPLETLCGVCFGQSLERVCLPRQASVMSAYISVLGLVQIHLQYSFLVVPVGSMTADQGLDGIKAAINLH